MPCTHSLTSCTVRNGDTRKALQISKRCTTTLFARCRRNAASEITATATAVETAEKLHVHRNNKHNEENEKIFWPTIELSRLLHFEIDHSESEWARMNQHASYTLCQSFRFPLLIYAMHIDKMKLRTRECMDDSVPLCSDWCVQSVSAYAQNTHKHTCHLNDFDCLVWCGVVWCGVVLPISER